MQGTRAWRQSGRRREGADRADPQDLHGRVKAVWPAVQCPVGRHEAHWQSACRQCGPWRVQGARSHAPPRVRQGGVNPPHGTNGPPPPGYDGQYESSAGWPKGGAPYGDGAAVVVRGRESRPHGEGPQVLSGQGHEVRERRRAATILHRLHQGNWSAGCGASVRHVAHRVNCHRRWPKCRANDFEVHPFPASERRTGQEHGCKAGAD